MAETSFRTGSSYKYIGYNLEERYRDFGISRKDLNIAPGPENKNIATKYFEQVILPNIIDNLNVDNIPKITYSMSEVIYEIQNIKIVSNEMMLNINGTGLPFVSYDTKLDDLSFGTVTLPVDGASIPLRKFIKSIDFTKVAITALESEYYSKYIATNEIATRHSGFDSADPIREQIKKLDPENKFCLQELSDASLTAIHLYTTEFYRKINDVLYYKLNDDTKPLIDTVLSTITFASHGLNVLPEREECNFETVYSLRNENFVEVSNKKQRIDFLNTHLKNNITFKADKFLSGSSVKDVFPSSIQIIFEKGVGKYIGPISALPDQEEILVPPSTTLLVTGYKEIQDLSHFSIKNIDAIVKIFTVTSVNDYSTYSNNIDFLNPSYHNLYDSTALNGEVSHGEL